MGRHQPSKPKHKVVQTMQTGSRREPDNTAMQRCVLSLAMMIAGIARWQVHVRVTMISVLLHVNGGAYQSNTTISGTNLFEVYEAARKVLGPKQSAVIFIADAEGGRALSALDLPLRDGAELYGGQAGDIFVWPCVRVGFVRRLRINGSSTELETLSISPRVFRVRGLLEAHEMRSVEQTARENGMKDSIYGDKHGNFAANSGGRQSQTAWMGLAHGLADGGLPRTETTDQLQQRATQLVGLQIGHTEPIQVVRYDGPSVGYRHHTDWLKSKSGSTRIATLLAFLNDGFDGGEGDNSKRGPGSEKDWLHSYPKPACPSARRMHRRDQLPTRWPRPRPPRRQVHRRRLLGRPICPASRGRSDPLLQLRSGAAARARSH